MTPTALTLSLFDIFRDLTKQQREEIAARMSYRTYSAGSYVISSECERNVYFLINGKIRACAYSEDGKQVYFEDLLPGMLFGELAAIDEGPRTGHCLCIEECHVAMFDKNTFLQMLEDYPSVNRAVLVRLVALVRRQLLRVYEYTTYSVNQRIRFELLRLACEAKTQTEPIVLPSVPTQTELADRISTHREAVSRELKLLEVEGLITWSRSEHIIHDRDGLLRKARVT